MNTLFAQLMKELKRSPVKAAVLGGGTLLAIWFWLPLVTGWFQSGDVASEAVASAPAPTVEAPSLNATAVAEPAAANVETPVDWRAIQRWRMSHANASTYAGLAGVSNPFVDTAVTVHGVAAEEEQVDQVESTLAIELAASQRATATAGLKLTSTLITSSGRLATINGKVYREGDEISLEGEAEEKPAPANDPPFGPTLRLRHVAARSVTLQHGTELIPLQLERARSRSIQIEFR